MALDYKLQATCFLLDIAGFMSDKVLERIVRAFYAQNGFDLWTDALLKLKRLIDHSDLLVIKLREVANDLDLHHFNSAIAKVTGGATGIAGTLVG